MFFIKCNKLKLFNILKANRFAINIDLIHKVEQFIVVETEQNIIFDELLRNKIKTSMISMYQSWKNTSKSGVANKTRRKNLIERYAKENYELNFTNQTVIE